MNSPNNTPNMYFPSLYVEQKDILPPASATRIPLVYQSNKLPYLKYKNGVLVDQHDHPTTPEEHNTTHAEILKDICDQHHMHNISEDTDLIDLIYKYTLQDITQTELDELKPVVLRRQYNYPGYLTYVDGELVDHSGSPTTPEKYHTTHAEILINMFHHRQSSLIYEYEEGNTEFLKVLHKYVPESVSLSPEEYYKLATPSPDGCITHYIDSSGNVQEHEISIVVGGISNTLRKKNRESIFNV